MAILMSFISPESSTSYQLPHEVAQFLELNTKFSEQDVLKCCLITDLYL